VIVEDRVAGVATVAASSLERANLPSARQRRRLPSYPLPVLRLGRLGADTRAQGLGIGTALLRHVPEHVAGTRIGPHTERLPRCVSRRTRTLEVERAVFGNAHPMFGRALPTCTEHHHEQNHRSRHSTMHLMASIDGAAEGERSVANRRGRELTVPRRDGSDCRAVGWWAKRPSE
jgi:GNAT superfamily N-acetyltransferase